MKKIPFFISAMAITAFAFAQNTYTMDKNHSRLGFTVRHFGISNVDGNFKTFNANLVSSKEDFSDAKIDMTADVSSINTDVDMRDKDLRENWFEVAKFPNITFKSSSFKKTTGKNYKLKGDITMHGVTKPIEFDVLYNGKQQNTMTKKYSHGFTISGKLNRRDFEIGGPPVTTGASEEVDLKSNVEFIQN